MSAARRRGLPWATVVGVVADTKLGARDEPSIEQWYSPIQQPAILLGPGESGNLPGGGYIALRSTLPPEKLIHVLRATVSEIDPLLPLEHVQTMDDVISTSRRHHVASTPRSLLAFAIAALMLALTGIYVVMRYLRLAADPGDRHSHGAWCPGSTFVELVVFLGIFQARLESPWDSPELRP